MGIGFLIFIFSCITAGDNIDSLSLIGSVPDGNGMSHAVDTDLKLAKVSMLGSSVGIGDPNSILVCITAGLNIGSLEFPDAAPGFDGRSHAVSLVLDSAVVHVLEDPVGIGDPNSILVCITAGLNIGPLSLAGSVA